MDERDEYGPEAEGPLEPVTERVRIIGAQPAGAATGQDELADDAAAPPAHTPVVPPAGPGAGTPSAPAFDLFSEETQDSEEPEDIEETLVTASAGPGPQDRSEEAGPRRHRAATAATPSSRARTCSSCPSPPRWSPTCRTGPIPRRARSRPCSTGAARTRATRPSGPRPGTPARRGASTDTNGTTAVSIPRCWPTTTRGWAPSRRPRSRNAGPGSSTTCTPPRPTSDRWEAEHDAGTATGSWWDDEDAGRRRAVPGDRPSADATAPHPGRHRRRCGPRSNGAWPRSARRRCGSARPAVPSRRPGARCRAGSGLPTGGPGAARRAQLPVAIATGLGFALVAVLCFEAGTVATLALATVVVALAAAEATPRCGVGEASGHPARPGGHGGGHGGGLRQGAWPPCPSCSSS